MSDRRLPLRPDLDQLRHQAKDLLRAIHRGDPDAIAGLNEHHPKSIEPAAVRLSDAQHILARAYGASSWPRLVDACRLVDAIWRDDIDAVVALVTRNPRLIEEHALVRDSNWGPPMSYAANLGRDRIVAMLRRLGATDTEWALGRAALQGKIQTARMLHEMLGGGPPPFGALAGPAYTLSVSGTAFMFEIGARIVEDGRLDFNTLEHLLGTDSRNPPAKHRILEMYIEHGFEPPDTPVMALHRGRIDLLERHLALDPALLVRTFTPEEIFPPEVGCHPTPYMAQGTPLDGATLLHIAANFNEIGIAEWLLDRGMDVDARAAVDADGFGGHTALFSTVVSQPNFWVNHGAGKPDEAKLTRLLLDRGADPNARATLRARLEPGHGETSPHDYPDVTPLSWGRRYHMRIFVSRESMRLVEERGGHE